MAEVVPFRGVLYNTGSPSLSSGEGLVAPPYDIITPEYREELYNSSPYNIVRVDFGKEFGDDTGVNNRYTRAKAFLDAWMREGVLMRSEGPRFYSYEISYTIYGRERTLRGFLGLVRLEELGKGSIHPHECTHSKPKKDRLDLMRASGANISPIFALYSSREKGISGVLADVDRKPPYIEARDLDGSVHRLREISDPVALETIRAELTDRPVFIADGHHRYETALEYRREMREKEGTSESPRPYDYVMMFMSNMSEEGLTILPTHRLVKKVPADCMKQLSAHFEIEEAAGDFRIADTLAGRRRVIGFYKGDADKWYILTYKGGFISDVPSVLAELDVSVLHELVLGKLFHPDGIAYEMDIGKCLEMVRSGEFGAAFFLNPTQVSEVEKVALASLRMPPKSTYFYPKLMTGLVLNVFKNTF
ncbi:MAG: DUF1015 domain-containing protein [Candidatus Sulfobium sp.]